MKDQHTLIKGYRDLSQAEIDLMNEAKELAEKVGAFVDKLDTRMPATNGPHSELMIVLAGLDKRWVSIGRTHLQQGFMALTRAVAQPTSF